MIKSLNKKAQGMSTSTIVLLILGIVILVVLILGFSLGWDRLAPWIKPDNNIDTVKASCSIACSTNAQYEFCNDLKDVDDGENDEFQQTCYQLATNSTYANRGYGIASCPQITCSSE